MKVPFRILPLVISLIAIGLTGCLSGGGGGGGGGSAAPTPPPTTTPTDPSTPTEPASAQINSVLSLSNDPVLVSGGDVLVEVQVANVSEAATDIVVKLNGEVVTNAFAVRGSERFVGLVNGLKVGENTIVASSKSNPSSSAQLVVKNHPSSGPIFSGPHLEPWICAQPIATQVTVSNPMNGQSAEAQTLVSGLSTAADENCGISSEVSYFYEPTNSENCTFNTTSLNACFIPFDTANPPPDAQIARFTNDRGDTVRSILAVEHGALNRGMYSLSAFHDPEKPHHAADPQKGWNNKVLVLFEANLGGSRFQVPSSGFLSNENALKAGYMIVNYTMGDHANNFNHALGAESLMMLKERIVEAYGPIRFTVGSGSESGEGGAIAQLSIASAYPGLLDGLIVGKTRPDELTMGIEASDCGLFSDTGGYLSSVPSDEHRDLILSFTGHNSTTHCFVLNGDQLPFSNPSYAPNCGQDFPASLVYDSSNNPSGLRCSPAEYNMNLLGSSTYPDGVTRANNPLDNVGVQYGLLALLNGSMSPEKFVHINETIGFYDLDQDQVQGPKRGEATLSGLERAYLSGLVTDGRYLSQVPIIDLLQDEMSTRKPLNWRAKSVRQRLINANGHYDNHVIWGYSSTRAPDFEAFAAMDRWLTSVEEDQTDQPLADKVGASKPEDVNDQCLIGNGFSGPIDLGLESADCPIKFGMSPRQVAGGPIAEDVLKCQLKPLDFNNTDYMLDATGELIVFSPDQQSRLEAVFADGVCDWSKPGVAQQLNPGWMSFADGPDGVPLELGLS